MTNKKYTLFLALIGMICGYVIINSLFFVHLRPVHTDVIQGILVGFGTAIITAQIVAKIKATKVNGWTTIYGLGVPGNGMLLRAACTLAFPGPVNMPQEAMYWTVLILVRILSPRCDIYRKKYDICEKRHVPVPDC